MIRYVGTFLGGPRDGEVLAAQHKQITLPRLASPVRWWEGNLDNEIHWKDDVYELVYDDDMRGWWVKR